MVYHAGLAAPPRRGDHLGADRAGNQPEARIPRRLHGARLVPVRVELTPAPTHDLLARQNPADEVANLRLPEVLRHPGEVVSAVFGLQQLPVGAPAVLLAGHPGVEIELGRLVIHRLALDADDLVEADILAVRGDGEARRPDLEERLPLFTLAQNLVLQILFANHLSLRDQRHAALVHAGLAETHHLLAALLDDVYQVLGRHSLELLAERFLIHPIHQLERIPLRRGREHRLVGIRACVRHCLASCDWS